VANKAPTDLPFKNLRVGLASRDDESSPNSRRVTDYRIKAPG